MAGVLLVLRNAPETVVRRQAETPAWSVPGIGTPRFRSVVAPMAPWVFAAPAIAFALLPSVVGADHQADGIALTAAITALTALAGVLIQPIARRLDRPSRRNRAGLAGLLVLAAGLALAALTAHTQQSWLLVPCAIVLGCAYGLCLVSGLIEVAQIAREDALARLTAAYYALTYLGFAAPYLLALAAHVASYPLLLAITAAVAVLTAAIVTRSAARTSAPMITGGLHARHS
jgi:MFS family permease